MRDSGKTESWLLQKIKENPFQFLWPLGLAFGGAILIGFFFQIGFMPDMSFSEASGIFIAVTLIGLIITFPIFLAMIPAILIQTSEIAIDIYKNNNLFCCSIALLFALFLFIGIAPDSQFYIYTAYFILCFLISYSRVENKTHQEKPDFTIIKSHETKCFCERIESPFLHQDNYFIIVDTLAWFIFPIVLLLIFSKYEGFNQYSNGESLFLFFLWSLLSCVFTWILITSSVKNDLKFWSIVIISYIAISLLFTGAITKNPSAIIRSLGLGEMRNVSVLLKDEGCEIFNAIPMPAGQKPLCDEKTKIVRSVHLRSRIASPYVFEVKGNGDQVWRIIIPKEQVISLIISGVYGSQPPNPGASNNQTQDCPDRNQSQNPSKSISGKSFTRKALDNMLCLLCASCHVPPNCPSKAKQESESRAQPC